MAIDKLPLNALPKLPPDMLPPPKDGDKGDQGVRGQKGDQGESIKGDTGERGPKGDSIKGDTGDTGDRGADGERGERGIDGAMGQKGETGKRGLRGFTGKRGKDGVDGKDGKAPAHAVKDGAIRFRNPNGTWGRWVRLPDVERVINMLGRGGLRDAPQDGSTYGRKDGAWSVVSSGVTNHSALTELDYASAGHTGFVPDTRTLSAGTGLTGGGSLAANRSLDLEDTAVTPASYTYASLTVDQQGRITAASSGAAPITAHSGLSQLDYASAGHTGFEPTLPLTTRGDILYRDAGNATARLPIGANTFVLTSDGTDVSWAAGSAYTSTVAGSILTGDGAGAFTEDTNNLFTASSVDIMKDAAGDVDFFADAASGEEPSVIVHGNPTGTSAYWDMSVNDSLKATYPYATYSTDSNGHYFPQRLVLMGGTASAPSLTFIGNAADGSDGNTGIFRKAENQFAITAGGQEYVFSSSYFQNTTANSTYSIKVGQGQNFDPTYGIYNSGARITGFGMGRVTGTGEIGLFHTSEPQLICGNGFVEVGSYAASGETPSFKLSGYRAGDALRELDIAVGVDGDESVSMDLDGVRFLWADYNGSNLGVGEATLTKVTSGTFNVSLGPLANHELTTGFSTMSIGSGAGYYGTNVQSNVNIGVNANHHNVSGNQCVCLGTSAGFSVFGNSHYSNVFIGDEAGKSVINGGNKNVCIGTDSAKFLTTGDSNVCIGHQSGDALTTGDDNIFIGHGIDPDAGTTNSQFKLGCTNANATPLLTGDLANNRLGIGTSGALTEALEVTGDVIVTGLTASKPVWTDANKKLVSQDITPCDLVVTRLTPSTQTVNTGTLTSGTVSDVQTWQDGNEVHITEVTGTPGFDVEYRIDNVADFCQIGIAFYYVGSSTHACEVQIYDDANTTWRELYHQAGVALNHNYRFSDFPGTTANYINSSDQVKIRFYHPQSGNASHDLYIDYVSIIGTST